MKIRDARSLPAVAQEDLRYKAVNIYLRGKTQEVVAEIFGVSRRAVNGWVRRYRKGGWRALKARKRGRPSGGRLKAWQCAQIAKTVIDHTPEQLRLPFYLWTREAVAQLIEKRFGIRYSLMQVGRFLRRWGFTPQKPVRRAYEQNPKEVRRWLEKEYPMIRCKAKRERAEINWCDEAGLRSDHATGRSYGRRGQTPVIPGTGQRFGCSMISTITNRGKLRFMVFCERFSAKLYILFLNRLIKDIKRKVYLIVDRHPVHRARKVQKWFIKNRKRIELFFLPSYSPDLNPDEMLNQDVKSNAVGRRRPHTSAEMIYNVRGYLRSRQRQPEVVKKYFQEENVRYAAE